MRHLPKPIVAGTVDRRTALDRAKDELTDCFRQCGDAITVAVGHGVVSVETALQLGDDVGPDIEDFRYRSERDVLRLASRPKVAVLRNRYLFW